MSLTSKSIALDQLPDQRIFNPLRGKYQPRRRDEEAPSAPAPPPPQQQQQPARGSGLFSRIAPAPPPSQQQQQAPAARDDADSSDEDAGDEDDARDERALALRRPRHAPVASGPFAKVANTNRCQFQFVAGFKDISGSLSKNSASVTIQFSEVLRHADTPDTFNKLDPKRTIPIYVRVAGTSLSDEFRNVCSLEVYDAASKPLYSKFVHKHNNSEAAMASGYPLFMYSPGAQNNIFFHPPELSADHKTYWTFTMATLERNTSMFVNPSTGEQYVIIKKDSACAKLMQYALSERNDIVRNPSLLENPAYQNPNDADNIRIPVDLYNKVKSAYRRKLGEIAATSFDLSSIRVVLKPLDLAKEMFVEASRSTGGAGGVPNVNHIWGHVAIEVYAHIPNAADDDDRPPAKAATVADEGSDEEL